MSYNFQNLKTNRMDSVQEIKMLRDLINNGVFYINVYSTDCDGVYSERSLEFKSEADFLVWETNFWEWCEGTQGFTIVDKENRCEGQTDYTGWCE